MAFACNCGLIFHDWLSAQNHATTMKRMDNREVQFMPRPSKPPLTQPEAQAALTILNGKNKTHGLRTAANEISRLRGAHAASTVQARKRRTVSARWLQRELEKCGKMPSAAKLRLLRGKLGLPLTGKSGEARDPDSHQGGRESPPNVAGVQIQEEAQPNGTVEVTAGDKA